MDQFQSQLLVANQTTIPRAEPFDTRGPDPVGYAESMQEWIASGRLEEDWSRWCSLIKFIDRTKPQIKFLLDKLPDGSNQWHFIEPPTESDFYQSLLLTGEVTVYFSEILPYLVDRL